MGKIPTVIKMRYKLTINYDLICDDEIIDYMTEEEYYDSYSEACKAKEKYTVGTVDGEWGDGTRAVVSSVDVADEPEEVEYYANLIEEELEKIDNLETDNEIEM